MRYLHSFDLESCPAPKLKASAYVHHKSRIESHLYLVCFFRSLHGFIHERPNSLMNSAEAISRSLTKFAHLRFHLLDWPGWPRGIERAREFREIRRLGISFDHTVSRVASRRILSAKRVAFESLFARHHDRNGKRRPDMVCSCSMPCGRSRC